MKNSKISKSLVSNNRSEVEHVQQLVSPIASLVNNQQRVQSAYNNTEMLLQEELKDEVYELSENLRMCQL